MQSCFVFVNITIHSSTVVVCALDDEGDYCPDRALSAALHDWMEELNQPLQAGKHDDVLEKIYIVITL